MSFFLMLFDSYSGVTLNDCSVTSYVVEQICTASFTMLQISSTSLISNSQFYKNKSTTQGNSPSQNHAHNEDFLFQPIH